MPHAKGAASNIVVHDAGRVRSEKDNDDYLVDELRTALAGDELTCYYQPKIRDDGRVHSVEALLRWNHPRRGVLLPEEFLPVAERAGLMRQVANRVVNVALGQARAWRDDGIRMTVAVNLSMANLLDLDLVDTIARLLATHNMSPESLILEITEGTFANDSSRSRKTVYALRRLGVRISLDDYGTGWSSLARLQDLSVDELKLDRVFVSRLAQDPRSIAIVRSTVALAHSLGADLVAEGVEDVGHAECVAALRLHDHAGLCAHPTAARRRAAEVDRPLHAGAVRQRFGAAPGPSVTWRSPVAGWSSSVARWAHNPEVAGSNPVPATR